MEVKKSVRPIVENIIAQYLPPALGGLVLILAWLSRQLELWQILLLGLVIFTVVIWLIIGIGALREKRKKNLTKLSNKELETTIREWVSISAWSTRPLDLKDDLLLGYELAFAENKSLVISRQKKEPDVIYLGTEIQFTSLKTEMSDADWERFDGQVSIEMARLGIMFSPKGKHRPWGSIQILEPVILDDALTSFYFRTRIFFVIRAFILVNELWKEALRQSDQLTLHTEGSQP